MEDDIATMERILRRTSLPNIYFLCTKSTPALGMRVNSSTTVWCSNNALWRIDWATISGINIQEWSQVSIHCSCIPQFRVYRASIVNQNIYVSKMLAFASILVVIWLIERPTRAISIFAFANARAVAFPIPLIALVIKARRFCLTLMLFSQLFGSFFIPLTLHYSDFEICILWNTSQNLNNLWWQMLRCSVITGIIMVYDTMCLHKWPEER